MTFSSKLTIKRAQANRLFIRHFKQLGGRLPTSFLVLHLQRTIPEGRAPNVFKFTEIRITNGSNQIAERNLPIQRHHCHVVVQPFRIVRFGVKCVRGRSQFTVGQQHQQPVELDGISVTVVQTMGRRNHQLSAEQGASAEDGPIGWVCVHQLDVPWPS